MSDGPDPVEASRRYTELAATYERRVRLTNGWRPGVVRRLRLRPGDHVLDVGCGTGANLPHLVAAVGATGHVMGIDLSEAMAAHARTRVAENSWDNVHVVIGDAAIAPLPANLDGALFFLVHDLVRSPAVVDRIVGACRPGARVVAFGPKWAPCWAWPLNAFVRRGIRPYVTTFEGLDAPWDHLQRRLNQFSVRPLALGTLYLAEGCVAS
jgi:phosphatidylethanolamine/phosphatidyl-N-methylethanolamine N-methyltransferase